jgi:hypothetical protein
MVSTFTAFECGCARAVGAAGASSLNPRLMGPHRVEFAAQYLDSVHALLSTEHLTFGSNLGGFAVVCSGEEKDMVDARFVPCLVVVLPNVLDHKRCTLQVKPSAACQ